MNNLPDMENMMMMMNYQQQYRKAAQHQAAGGSTCSPIHHQQQQLQQRSEDMNTMTMMMMMMRGDCKNPWTLDQDSLLSIAATNYQRSLPPMPTPTRFPNIMIAGGNRHTACPEDITSRVLADLSDDTLLDAPLDDIFDDLEPVPLADSGQRRLAVLQETLDQVLSIESIFLDDEYERVVSFCATPTPTPLATVDMAAPTPTKRASMSFEVPGAKRRRLVSPDSYTTTNSNTMTMVVESEEDAAKRFRPYQAEQWTEKFDELLDFKKLRGHCCVPHTFDENPSLARWVKRQRYQYKLKNEVKSSTMTDERIVALEQSGFVWDSHSAAWLERWNELVDFHREFRHANVPSNHVKSPQLATWVKCQRRQYKLFCNGKASNMTLDRINKLEQVSFEWELRASSKKL